jgi:peptidoglycan/xylan/chitin deacetylase (PgdA/CDA1 family)
MPSPQRASALGRPIVVGIALSSVALSLAMWLGASVPGWLFVLSLLALVAGITTGVVSQSSGIFARPLISVRTPRPELAITFDDGPHPLHTPPLLDALDARGHRATFFIVGSKAAQYPELLKEIARRGHALANHSYHHSYVTNLVPPARLAEELDRTSDLIAAAAGSRSRWFRPPVGLLSPRIAEAARRAKLDLVAWTETARDGVASRTVNQALARLEHALEPGAILVLHDGVSRGERTPIALPLLNALLDRLEAKGLHSVTLDELLRE